MTSEVLIFVLACVTMCATSVYMIWAPCYEDGIVGKLALGAIALGAAAVLYRALTDPCTVAPAPQGILMAVGGAIFLSRHLVRFWQHRRRHRATDSGSDRAIDWRKARMS